VYFDFLYHYPRRFIIQRNINFLARDRKKLGFAYLYRSDYDDYLPDITKTETVEKVVDTILYSTQDQPTPAVRYKKFTLRLIFINIKIKCI